MKVNILAKLIDDEVLTVTPSLAAAIGINEAHIVQQVNYWNKGSEKRKSDLNYRDGHYWVFKTANEWGSEFPWLSPQAIARYLRALRGAGILVATDRYNFKKSDRTLWYRVNHAAEIDIIPPAKRRTKK